MAANMQEKTLTTVTMRREKTDALSTGRAARLAIRRNQHAGPTSGVAPGFVQANLAILPQALAQDFLQFCRLNPKPCPLIGVSAPGDPRVPALGEDLDIRTDLPRYRIWRNGALVEEPTDVLKWWRDDLVTFAIGCSFSFEEALLEAGIELRHMTCDCTVPMYRTSVETGAAVPVHEDEIPVFWACGVTPQSVIMAVRPDFCITHYPGGMLVTDRRNTEFAIM